MSENFNFKDFNNFNFKDFNDLLEKKARLKGIEAMTKTDKNELYACQMQLISYGALIESQISYNRRYEYFSLIKEFLDKRTDPNIFRGEFLKMQEADDDATKILGQNLQKLSCFSFDLEEEIDIFSSLIDLIYNNSMIAIEFDPEGEDGISEDEFRNCIEAEFSKCKKFYKLY